MDGRYNYSVFDDRGRTLWYTESTPEEDKLDMVDGQMCVLFSGPGFMEFWRRCIDRTRKYKRARAHHYCFCDTYTGDEKAGSF